MRKRELLIQFMLAFLAPVLVFSISLAGEVLVKGDGFVITDEDIKSLGLQPSLVLKNKLLLKKMLARKLFALEARRMGLASQNDTDSEAAQKYTEWLIDSYKISDLAIESYYYSHYASYQTSNGTLEPLTDALKRKIAEKIKSRAFSNIVMKKLDELIKKYHVAYTGDLK